MILQMNNDGTYALQIIVNISLYIMVLHDCRGTNVTLLDAGQKWFPLMNMEKHCYSYYIQQKFGQTDENWLHQKA